MESNAKHQNLMTRIWIKKHARKFTKKHKIYQSNGEL